MINLIENPNFWLVASVILVLLEIFIGSLVFFLPLGISSLIVGLILLFQSNTGLIIISEWPYSLLLWGIISILLSFLLQKFFKTKGNGKDINDY
tara:strand:+ start:363 stop:644 length:282 start_codon:yes stop_codon:yes gene_type:complete